MEYKTQLISEPLPQSGLLGHYPDTSDRDSDNTDENMDENIDENIYENIDENIYDAEDHNKQVRQISKDV